MAVRLKLQFEKIKKHRPRLAPHFVPSFISLLNGICGFVCVVKTVESAYALAALYLLLAAVCDFFDGLIARTFKLTSSFGSELDSLCDAISFCLAPTCLIACWLPLNSVSSWIPLLCYLCAGLMRLARHNVTKDTATPHWFNGMPTTVAASLIAVVVLITQKWTHLESLRGIFFVSKLLILTLSALMISSIPFPHPQAFFSSLDEKIVFGILPLIPIVVAIFFFAPTLTVFLVFCCIMARCYRRL